MYEVFHERHRRVPRPLPPREWQGIAERHPCHHRQRVQVVFQPRIAQCTQPVQDRRHRKQQGVQFQRLDPPPVVAAHLSGHIVGRLPIHSRNVGGGFIHISIALGNGRPRSLADYFSLFIAHRLLTFVALSPFGALPGVILTFRTVCGYGS